MLEDRICLAKIFLPTISTNSIVNEEYESMPVNSPVSFALCIGFGEIINSGKRGEFS